MVEAFAVTDQCLPRRFAGDKGWLNPSLDQSIASGRSHTRHDQLGIACDASQTPFSHGQCISFTPMRILHPFPFDPFCL